MAAEAVEERPVFMPDFLATVCLAFSTGCLLKKSI
jgi:hypothetical protein